MFRIVYENERLSDSRNVLRKQTEGKRINLFWGGVPDTDSMEDCVVVILFRKSVFN